MSVGVFFPASSADNPSLFLKTSPTCREENGAGIGTEPPAFGARWRDR